MAMLLRPLLVFVLVVALAGANRGQGATKQVKEPPNGVYLCSKLPQLRNVDIKKLGGYWQALELTLFYPGLAALNVSGTRQQNRLERCGFYLTNVTDASLLYVTESDSKQLNVSGPHSTHWQFDDGREMVLLSADPRSHMVWAECKGDRQGAEGQSGLPAGDKFLAELTLISRDPGNGPVLSAKDLAALRERMKKLIGFTVTEVKPEPIKC